MKIKTNELRRYRNTKHRHKQMAGWRGFPPVYSDVPMYSNKKQMAVNKAVI